MDRFQDATLRAVTVSQTFLSFDDLDSFEEPWSGGPLHTGESAPRRNLEEPCPEAGRHHWVSQKKSIKGRVRGISGGNGAMTSPSAPNKSK
ncbi:hypothetical protein PRBEI_2001823800 [Prionailurus iriomotensis]